MVLDNGTTFYGYLYSDNKLTMNNYAAVYGRVTARYLSMDAQSSINEAVLPPMLTCFADGFDSAQINPDSWVAQRNNSTLPSVQNGRLRLTQNITDQATSATFQRLFGAGNLVTVEFDQYAYKTSGTSGADGMAVVLGCHPDAATGGLWWPAGLRLQAGSSGFAGGWLGVGLDEYGNYANEGGATAGLPAAGGLHPWFGVGHLGLSLSDGDGQQPEPARRQRYQQQSPHRYRITVDSAPQATRWPPSSGIPARATAPWSAPST